MISSSRFSPRTLCLWASALVVLSSISTSLAAEPDYAKPPVFTPLPVGNVTPEGWLRDWCQQALEGIAGHADELDPAFARGWLDPQTDASIPGLKKEAMQQGDKVNGYVLEQAGYWLDGASRLAHLMGDEALLAKCRLRFESVIQRIEAGRPPTELNGVRWDDGEKWAHWPMAVLGRALVAEYSFNRDPRYLHAIEKIYNDYARFDALTNTKGRVFSLIEHRGRQPLNIEAMLEAYRLGGRVQLRDDAVAVLRSLSDEIDTRLHWHEQGLASGKMDSHFYSVAFGHAVTVNETAKIPAIGYLFSGEADWLRFSELCEEDMEQNAMLPYGLTPGHEEIGGVGPFACTEMCNVVDYAWSNTWLLRITGKPVYGDRVERDVFNAGPGGIAPDFKSHVYYLSPNRIDATHPAKPGAGGLTSYAPKQQPLCCTGNISRLLPNYVGSLWMASADGGFAATLYGPSVAVVSVGDTKIRLETQTDYPFGSDIMVKVTADQPREFPLYFRLPSWCKNPRLAVNGQPREIRDSHGFARLQQLWKTGDTIRLSLPMEAHVVAGRCADGAPYTSVTYGPLLFALPIPVLNHDLNAPDPTFAFQYALQPGSAIQATHAQMPSPWSWDQAPVRLTVPGETVAFGPNLTLPKAPTATTNAPLTKLTLRPFGATAFRISMFAAGDAK